MAAGNSHPHSLTIVLEFQGPHSERSIEEMKRESQDILKQTGLQVDWRVRREVDGAPIENLVVVRLKGRCIWEPLGYLYDERGPLASTRTSDGVVLPFSEVACDKVVASVRSAMFGGDYAHADLLLGRALGRVLAHELVHLLARSQTHGQSGVAKPSLSGKQLIQDRLELSERDLDRLR
jgi:hypothetical protein